MIFANFLLLFIGFVALIKGAGWLVDGASSLAKRLGISSLIIGLTVVAFGTSTPELIVNIFASIRGSNDLALGNILGSNISNTFLILGITATIIPLTAKSGTVWKEIPLAFLAILLVGAMANDAAIDGRDFSVISRIDGFVLISFFVIFLYYIFGLTKVQESDRFQVPIESFPMSRSLLLVGGGTIGLALGGSWIIDSARAIAETLGIAEGIIGLTIVALGTSLPELATSVTAAYRKDVDIALGNVVGSNIFNLFWVLGVTAIISPIEFSTDLLKDVWVAIIAAFLLFIFMFMGKRHTLEKWQGIIFVLIYVFYIIFLAFR